MSAGQNLLVDSPQVYRALLVLRCIDEQSGALHAGPTQAMRTCACACRYYVAEGVKLFAQETWRLVMADTGRLQVAKHIDEVVRFYIAQSRANNHAVREAACACIAELMEKVRDTAYKLQPQHPAHWLCSPTARHVGLAYSLHSFSCDVPGHHWYVVMAMSSPVPVVHTAPECQSPSPHHRLLSKRCAYSMQVDRTAVTPHVPTLLRALTFTFKDASWPVRDAACSACGRCALAYPDAMRPLLPELTGLWLAHIGDNIPSVREDSAIALGKVCMCMCLHLCASLVGHLVNPIYFNYHWLDALVLWLTRRVSHRIGTLP